jgi:hypothetical protein
VKPWRDNVRPKITAESKQEMRSDRHGRIMDVRHRESVMRHRTVLLALLGTTTFASGAASAGDGLVVPDGRDLWPQWQARITVSTNTLAPVSLAGVLDNVLRGAPQLGALVGDFYFDAPGLRLPSSLGGLRATGGLMAGSRGLSWGMASVLRPASHSGLSWGGGLSTPTGESRPDPLPYVGLGYTGMSLKGGWGVSADLGLVADYGGAASFRTARSPFGVQGMDNMVRDLRLSPVLQVGISYAF